jgi:hypothetical protein
VPAVSEIRPDDRKGTADFVLLPYRLHQASPHWVPPIFVDQRAALDRRRHPFHEHSEAGFFIVRRGGRAVGRIAVQHNRPYNELRGVRRGAISLFECEDDLEAAIALLDRADTWARERRLEELFGPRGFGPLDGYGLLIEGFEQRQTMTMAAWNPPYYRRLLEQAGFVKEVDFTSFQVSAQSLQMPPGVTAAARRVRERKQLRVKTFRSLWQLWSWIERIGGAYNRTFAGNWEYYPLTRRELRAAVLDALPILRPGLIKLLLDSSDEVVGFLFAFPDVSAALQRARGHLGPRTIFDLLREARRTRTLAINGIGVLPRLRGRGANALLYSELQETVQGKTRYVHTEMTQVADTVPRMHADLERMGAIPYKVHRVFRRPVGGMA